MYGKRVLFSRVVSLSNVRYFKKDSSKKLLEFLAGMPKANSARILENQRQRQHIAKKSEKYGPSCVYLQVLGSGARGAPNTLYLFTDQKRYLFNCGECTQRLAHEHKVKLSRLDHIFITSKTWKNIGGLPGLSLTLQDVGVPSITLHGPEGLDELYSATKRFVIMKDMNVTMAKCSPSEDFEDNVMSVKYVILGPNDEIFSKDLKPAAKRQKLADPIEKGFEEFFRDDTDYYKPELRNYDGSARRHVKPKPMPGRAASSMDNQDPMKRKTEKVLHDLQKKSHCTVSYICTLKKRLGTLDLAKCVELGVKPGPMLGQLKNGHDVVLPDGTLVLSKDVKTPDDPGPVFIVLDVPNISYLKESEFSAHFANGVNPPENIPTLIVHFSPPEVFHSESYKGFLALFGPTTRHLILNGQNSCLGSESAHRTQHKLHLLDPDIFPLLKDVSMPAVWNAHPPIPKTNSPIRLKGMEELKNKFQNIINMEGSPKGEHRPPSEEPKAELTELIAGRTLTMFHLRPKRQLDRTSEPKLHIQDYIQETMDVDGFVGSLEQFRRLVDSMRYTKRGSQQEYPKVVFLGTGSCIPSKTRNTSAIVIHVDENRSILLDCGEGTFGQLVRFYGPKKVNSFLRTLRAIYISHLHADHHIGLIGVLQARRQAYEEISHSDPPDPICLLAPGQIVSWLSLYDLQFERIRNEFTLIPNQNLLVDSTPELSPAILASLGLQQLHTCHVVHCPNAFGVALHISNYKITYSGDTLPCETLVKLGQDSTLLIHEATMEDELADEARMKMHSTTTQAIEIGRQMNAQYTVLTHFSQRYARLPRLNANILNDNDSVGIAFDNMQITMSDLDLLPHMYAPLQLMFAEHCVEMELKAAHRACQKLRAEARRSFPDIADSHSRPGSCRGSASSPSRGRYKESNSSKLRARDSKSKSPRSASQSPPKMFNNYASSRTGSSGRSTPKVSPERSRASDMNTRVGTHSGRSTPKLRARSDFSAEQPRSVDFGPRSITGSSGRCTPKSKAPSEITPDSRPRFDCSSRLVANSGRSTPKPRIRNDLTPERTRNLDNSTPRTLSLTSNKSKDTDRSRESAENNVYIVDTRSKTLNTASRPNSVPAVPQARRGPHVTNSGQVKPVSQRLPPPIRKPEAKPIPGRPQSNEKMAFNRSKSPIVRKVGALVENSRCYSSVGGDTSKSKIPTKRPDSGNKTRPTISNVSNVKSEKSPVRSPAPVKGLKGSASTQNNKLNPSKSNNKDTHNNAETKSGEPSSKIRLSTTKSTTSTNSSASQKDKKEKNAMNKENNSSRANSPKRQTPPKSPQVVKYNLRKPEQNIHDNPDRSKPVKPKRSVTLLKNTIQENAKRTGSDKVRPIPLFNRIGSPNHNNRGFRPQLEDIKSSFLLLNKKQNPANAKQKLPDVTKPKPISEEERRQKLLEVKKSFQSKGFFQDSKYDKIEGLNWITWK